MTSRAIIACGALSTHIQNIVKTKNWDITVYPLPPILHNNPRLITTEVEKKWQEISALHESIAIAYADCGTYGELGKLTSKLGLQQLSGNHCYDTFAGAKRIETLQASDPGTFFLTDFLVRSFSRSVIADLGIDRFPDLKSDYFRHYQKIHWLSQNPNEELRQSAKSIADFLELELTEEYVGEKGLIMELERFMMQL